MVVDDVGPGLYRALGTFDSFGLTLGPTRPEP